MMGEALPLPSEGRLTADVTDNSSQPETTAHRRIRFVSRRISKAMRGTARTHWPRRPAHPIMRSSTSREIACPDGSAGGSRRNGLSQALDFRDVSRSPIILLGPAADNGDVEIGQTETDPEQIRPTGNMLFHDQPALTPDPPCDLPYRLSVPSRIRCKAFGIR